MTTSIQLGGNGFEGHAIATPHTMILIISARQGFLGCGYVSLATAEKVGDAVAIVTGVKTFDDMLKAEVRAVSPAAAALGVAPGMTGEAALLTMA